MPSTIAASTTWPWPESRASSRAASTPMTRYVEPPPKSPTRLAGKCGRGLVLAHAEQGAGDRDVVHVVPGRRRQRAGLAPAGHPAVDQPRVALEAHIGAEAEPLGGAGAHPLDEHVGLRDQVEHGRDRLGVLQVERDAGTAAVEQVGRAAGQRLPARPLDADHVGAEVGQDHAGVRAGADAGDLDDLDPREGSGALSECVGHAGDSDSCAVRVARSVSRSVRGHVSRVVTPRQWSRGQCVHARVRRRGRGRARSASG